MSDAVDQAMESLLSINLTAEDWRELSERARLISEDVRVGEYMEVSAIIGDIEPWDRVSNPGEDSIHYDTWLANEEAEAESAHWGTNTWVRAADGFIRFAG